ncbi:hypothetical protein U1Q18_013505, partial [Sarracenia purpurea var. burkii]
GFTYINSLSLSLSLSAKSWTVEFKTSGFNSIVTFPLCSFSVLINRLLDFASKTIRKGSILKTKFSTISRTHSKIWVPERDILNKIRRNLDIDFKGKKRRQCCLRSKRRKPSSPISTRPNLMTRKKRSKKKINPFSASRASSGTAVPLGTPGLVVPPIK